MSKRDIIIIWGGIVTMFLLYNNTPKKKTLRLLNRCIEDYISNYEMLKNLIDKQYNLHQILEHLAKENSSCEILPFYIGDSCLVYKDTTEMRRCFLNSGEFIIELAEELRNNYSIVITSENDKRFMIVMDILKDVRKKTLMLGENAQLEETKK